MCLKKRKKIIHRKLSLFPGSSRAQALSSVGITGVNIMVSPSLYKIQLYMILV